MILLDSRSGSIVNRDAQRELQAYISRGGVKAEIGSLEFGDACFEANGPDGRMLVGIERKTVGDMLNCIDDARYSAHQRPGMKALYQVSMLMVEGVVKPDTATGYLMECIQTLTWRPYRYRSQMVRYSKLFRYLLSVQFAGTVVVHTRDVEHTAYNITECYHYFQKRWVDHTSLLETQKINIPDLRVEPSLVRKWAADLGGVGVKLSMDAERVFKTGYNLAKADETEWLQIPGVGVKRAQNIIQEVHGNRKR